MKYRIILLILALYVIAIQVSSAQGVITIDHKTQRFINDVSTLDRTKYIHAYLTIRWDDPKFTALKEEYNFHPDYTGGRGLSNPATKVKSDIIPEVSNKYTGVREVDPWYVTGGRPSDIFWDETVDYGTADVTEYNKKLADYVAKSLKSEWDDVGKYFEPMNEPMVHAKDFILGSVTSEKRAAVITKMCEYHDYVGKAIHATPELQNVKVTGYASAYPEFESNNFEFWEQRFGKFIDIAGEEMDVFSIHLYDGSGLNNSGGRRSGSNSEALLDIIEAYSFKKLGEVKPLAVSEYGRLVPNQPDWVSNSGNISNYHPVTNSQAVRSQLHLVMNFMERGDHFELGIPFSTNRGDDPTYIYAKASLWTKNEQGEIELSMRKYFFEMLKDLKGERVRINSSNVDVQTQAFVNGNQLYVMLNNLNDNTQKVDLTLLDSEGLESVDVKQLKVFLDKVPELTNSTEDTAPESISLEYGETAVLTYHFDAPISFDNKIVSKKIYSNDFLKAITAGGTNTFSFDDVEVGPGLATLRLGVGREHGLSLKPEVTINGTKVNVKKDVIRGPAQPNRSQFFGVLEIPFPIDLLNVTGGNTVEVKFPDTGGKISSAILQVEKADNEIEILDDVSIGDNLKGSHIKLYPNPVENELFIQGVGYEEGYQIYSSYGNLVLSGSITSGKINVSQLSKGVYLIRIEDAYVKFLKV